LAIKANPRSPLFEQYCAFTGKLQKYTRKEAMQVLEKIGGFSERGVTKKTRFLILGTQVKDGKSNKQLKAETYLEKGQNIEIIPENLFYEMLEAISYGQICMDEWLFRCKSA
jgi:DNA polymerase-3 subunit epsilon